MEGDRSRKQKIWENEQSSKQNATEAKKQNQKPAKLQQKQEATNKARSKQTEDGDWPWAQKATAASAVSPTEGSSVAGGIGLGEAAWLGLPGF